MQCYLVKTCDLTFEIGPTFWQEHEQAQPLLASLAQDLLSTPALQDVERVFHSMVIRVQASTIELQQTWRKEYLFLKIDMKLLKGH